TVHAFASAAGDIQLQEGAIVVGNTNSHASLFTTEVSIVSSFTMPTVFASSVQLEPEMQDSITPGAFSSLTVKSRATLALSAGTYFVGTLNLEPQGRLELANAEGPVEVHVLDHLN